MGDSWDSYGRLPAAPKQRTFAIPAFRASSGVEPLSAEEIRRAVVPALAEDIGSGDVTTLAAVPETAQAKAEVRAREPLVVAGLALAEAAFRELSTACRLPLSLRTASG